MRWLARVALAVALLAVVIGDGSVAVFAAIVAANVVLGVSEAVPISAYGMFASPAPTAWVVRVEDASGQLVPIGGFGVPPGNAHKRFSAVEHEAITAGASPADARRAATDDLVAWIETARRGHRLEEEELRLVHTTWRQTRGEVQVTREHLATVPAG